MEQCCKHVQQSTQALEKLGFIINKEKSCLIPSQITKFLGFTLITKTMKMYNTDERKITIKNYINAVVRIKKIKIRQFSKFIGHLTSVCPGTPDGWIYTKNLKGKNT